MNVGQKVTTPEDLDALQEMTILVDQYEISWQKFIDDQESDGPTYWAMDGTKCYEAKTVLSTYGRKLTVVWLPQ